jgi:hypothetical protein
MKNHFNTLLIAAAVVISAVLFSQAFLNRNKHMDTISVTGLGSKDFISDLIVWNGSFRQKDITLKEAYAKLDTDRERVRQYIVSKGIDAKSIVFSAVEISSEFDERYDEHGNRVSSVFTGYRLNQQVSVESKEVDKVEGLSREVSELIQSGIEFYSQSPQYYYTKLAELKIEMIAAATRDARERADNIAKNAGSTVGALKKADMGVFQIVAQNSSEDFSWGGSFNTSSKRKTANITVRLEYMSN